MTRDGLTEENLRDGSVKDISHRSRGRPENKEEFVPERERKKAENEDSKSGKGKRLQMEKIYGMTAKQTLDTAVRYVEAWYMKVKPTSIAATMIVTLLSGKTTAICRAWKKPWIKRWLQNF